MSRIIELLERAGRETESETLAAALRLELRHGLPGSGRAWSPLAGYISAPDHEPCPSDVPERVPDDPDRQEPEAA